MRAPRAIAAAMVVLACIGVLAFAGAGAVASAQPIEMAAPYEYLGWGNPQPPTAVMAATGVQDLTLAFILSRGACSPAWDGERPLTGGPDQAAIESIRAAGGEVVVSFGGWSGSKLGVSCKTAESLAGAYQKVIDAYSLHAIDIDIERSEFTNAKTRKRVVAALAIVQNENPGLEISVTFGTGEGGPEADGRSLIADAAAIGFQPTAWTIMPFDFGAPVSDMGQTSIEAARGLAQNLASTYRLSAPLAYEHIGISSMNGDTDERDETVGLGDFQAILTFAQEKHLARLSFWSVNRDRPCAGARPTSETCSGISQQPYAFTDLLAQYHG